MAAVRLPRDHVLGVLAHLRQRAPAAQRVDHHRRRGDVEAVDRGLLDVGRQLVADLRHALAHTIDKLVLFNAVREPLSTS